MTEKPLVKRVLNQFLVSSSDNRKAAPRTAIENRKWVGIFAIVLVFAMCGAVAQAQQPKKSTRVCQLGNNSANRTDIYTKMFRKRLAQLGYVEGQSVIFEQRFYEGKLERLPELAAELVRLNCDVILTRGTEAAEAAKNATKTIPVVMAFADNVVRSGIVADLAHPGGNITGLTTIGAEIYGKRLELLKETVPKLTRVAFFWSPSNSTAARNVKETEPVARYLRVGIQSLEVKRPEDLDDAFRAAAKGGSNGLMLAGGGLFAFHEKRIVDLAVKHQLPAIYVVGRFVEVGGLMSYAEDRLEMFRRATEIVDKILKGTKPADIPVERPKKYDFVINLKAAKQIGLTIPPEVLARANRIIR